MRGSLPGGDTEGIRSLKVKERTSREAGEEPQVMGAKPRGMDPPPYLPILAHHDRYYLHYLARFGIVMWSYGEELRTTRYV
jgi:hypothetical protein